MPVTYDREAVVEYWEGEGSETRVDDDTRVLFSLNLTDTRGATAWRVLEALLLDLNGRMLDPNELHDAGAEGWLFLPLPGLEVVAVSTPWPAPVQYLDALCAELTSRGWQGRLTFFNEPHVPWQYNGPQPATITTMLGYGLADPPTRPPYGGVDVWRDDADLHTRLVDLCLDWVEAGTGPLHLWARSFAWSPSREQARELLLFDDGGPRQAFTVGRIAGPTPERTAAGYTVVDERRGRTASLSRGHVLLTECYPKGSLVDRLAEHHHVLAHRSEGAVYGLTRATVGYPRSGTVYFDPPWLMEDHEFRRLRVPPRQLPEHTRGLPGAYYAQMFANDFLDGQTRIDETYWRREDVGRGRTLITARTPDGWFTTGPNERRGPGHLVHGPSPATAAQARASLAGMLQQPLES